MVLVSLFLVCSKYVYTYIYIYVCECVCVLIYTKINSFTLHTTDIKHSKAIAKQEKNKFHLSKMTSPYKMEEDLSY